MSEQPSTTSAYDSPFRLLAIIAASVFVSEALVMIVLVILPPLPHGVAAPLDAALVTILIFPILYRFVVRPMTQHISERRQAEAALNLQQFVGTELQLALEVAQQRQAEVLSLLKGARAVLEYRDFKEVAEAILKVCKEVIGATGGYVVLPSEDRANETVVVMDFGHLAQAIPCEVETPGRALRAQVYSSGKAVCMNDYAGSESMKTPREGHLALNNIILAPMAIQGFVVGLICLADKSGGFSEDDVRLTTTFAELAAISLLNSQTLELLERSEERFRTLAQATFEGIAITEEGIIREVNEQFAQTYGCKPSDVIGKPVTDFLMPEQQVMQTVTGSEDRIGEYRALRKDGSTILLEARGRMIERGGRSMRVTAMRDITERKHAEEALHARNALLSSIIESPESAIFSVDREYRYTSFNRQHARIMKALFGADIQIGANLLEYHTVAGDQAAAKQSLDRALSGESFVIEDWAGDDVLARRCFEISHNPVRDADQIIGASVFAQDITERKYADQMLRENEEWLRLAFDASELGRWRFSVATGMIHFDARARVHTGSSANDVSLTEALASIHPDDRERLQQDMASILDPASDGRYAAEYRVTWPDEEVRWLAVQARVYFEGEGTIRQPVLAVGISQDITARKQMEEALRESRSDLDRAQEVGQIGSWRLDIRRDVLTWSAENHRIFGVPMGTPMTYETFLGTVHPDDREYVDRQWTAGLAGEPYDIEHRIIAAGTVKWVREKAYLEFDQDGTLLGGFGITQDITARKQARERIIWLASFPELNPSPVVEVDLAGHIHYLNPAAQRLLPELQTTGQQHPWLTDLELLGQKLQADSTTVLTREIALSGASYQQTLTYVPNSQRVRIYSLDITARKQAEEAMRRQAALIDLSPDAIIVRYLDGTITLWSQGARKLYGWSQEEALGQPIDSLLCPQLPEPLEQIVEQLRHTGQWSGEILQRTRSGIPVVVQSWWLAQFDAQGEIAEIFESNVDFTVRKQMEEQLRHAHDELELRVLARTAELAAANNELRLQSAALAAAANGILITDRQGDVQWCNPAFTHMTGYASEEILGRNPRLLKSDDQPPQFYQRMWETILSGQVWHGELINRRKDGSVYVEEQTISPVLNESGEVVNFVAVKQDVTERRRAENRLKQQNRELLALSNAERHARQIAETLSAANLALTQTLELDAVMETLLDYVGQLVPFDSANVMLLETESRLVVRVARGYERWTDSQLVRAIAFDVQGNRIFRELLASRQSVLIQDTQAHPDWDTRSGAEHVRSWIGVPIVAGGQVIGIYSLDKATPNFFASEHVRLAEALVGQAAVAIQNAWLFDQIRTGQDRLQSLSRHLVELQEAERHYVARELHDEAGQALTSLVYGLGELEHEADPDRRLRRLAELKQMTQEVLESLHRLAMDLRPASLDYLGLVPAMHQYVKATGERYGLIAQCKAMGLTDERLPPTMETALYRIVQEALTNVVRHARATRIDVLLERRDNQIVLVIEDDGSGFEVEHRPQAGHLGLVGMQERAEMLGGTLVLESAPGSGTTIVVEVPCVHSDSYRG